MSQRSKRRMTPAEVVEALEEVYAPCTLCEQRCGAMRPHGERGACGLADEVHLYNRLLHVGEEAPLVPSLAIFNTGCSMACNFCSEAEHLLPPFAPPAADPELLALRVAVELTGKWSAAQNINFVGGEPGIILPFIARFARRLDELVEQRPPILLNTNGYLTPRALELAAHLCEIFVVDLKFGNDACAQSIANVQDYWAVLTRNLRWLHQRARSNPNADPVPDVVLWVRHLLMPGHLACCTSPTLRWLAEHAPHAHVNVMPAFHPFGLADNAPWRALTKEESEQGRAMLEASGLELAWFDGRRLRRA